MKFLKTIATAFLLTAIAAVEVRAQWTDVTKTFLANPNLDSNADGWDYWSDYGQNMGYQGATYINSGSEVQISNFVELWRPDWAGTLGDGAISQAVTLPKGKYRLQADGIASWQGESGTQQSGVSLYVDATGSGGQLYTTPMSTENGQPQHFALEFDVAVEQDVVLGVLLQNTDANWVAADNFRLDMRTSDMVQLTKLSITPTAETLGLGDKVQLKVTYTPNNATIKSCTFESSNESVAKVDAGGLVTAIGVGTTIITAVSVGGSQTGSCHITVEKPEYVDGAIVINEIQASNVDAVLDPSFNYGSWIELYNPTDNACGLAGLYITDDPENLTKHKLPYMIGTLPAHGYKNIWFDHFGIWNMGELTQVDFKLDYDGGTIIVSDGTKILTQQTYPQAIGRTSYARTTDGGDTWAVSTTPTPEATNTGMTFATEQLESPIVDTDGQVFGGSLSVNVQIPSGATLRYTTDGSTPTMENGEVSRTGRFDIESSCTYRFRLFRDGMIPSEVVTRSYIRDDSGLPIIAIATDKNNLYSEETGIFVKGPNGRAGNGQDEKCNWNMDWDRPANFEYITENNEYALSQEVDISTCGGWSRANWLKSFKIKAAKYYQGENYLEHQFFEGKPFLKHKVLQIRNGGNDSSRLTDASLQEVMRRSGLNVETQSYKPVRVYINGMHYGDLNMREPNNKHYGLANYGIDTDEMDQFEMSPDSGYVQMVGTKDSYTRLIELSYDAANSATYAEICKLLDIDQYINYMAAELYLGNWDWPQNNVKGFRDQNDGKFHFVIFDLDGSFHANADINMFQSKKYYTFDHLRGEDGYGNSLKGQRKEEEIEFVVLFENLLKNEEFRRKYVDAICVIGGSTFHPDFANPIVEEIANELGAWPSNITDRLRNRQPWVAGQLTWGTYDFGVSSSDAISASLNSGMDGADLYINDMAVPTGRFSGVLYRPITIKAVAPTGYKFKGWRLAAGSMMGNGTTKSIFGKGSTWSYYNGTHDLHSQNWRDASYASAWPKGGAPVGYDVDSNPKGLKTMVSNKTLPTYYFSKTFNVEEKGSTDRFFLDYTVDDGMIVYINGQEAGRYNMPSGEVSYATYSSTWAHDNPDSGQIELPAGLFTIGQNTIAVEVHNNNDISTDIYWDASLQQFVAEYVSTDPEYDLSNGDNLSLVAEYEAIAEEEIMASGAFPIKVNELSAGNSIYVNDYFKRDDWIELYNTTDKSIDVAGMYLSDTPDQPQKFQIPDNSTQQTVIEPHGHMVVWASKRVNKGEQVHANFKLSNTDGNVVVLTSEDGSWSDKLAYDAHDGKESVSLYPDGGNDVYVTPRPTIGKANELTSYAQFLYTNTYEPKEDEKEDEKEEEKEKFVLGLDEGWNWVSHPLERNVGIDELGANALKLVSHTAEATNDGTGRWTGTLTQLEPARAYKAQMAMDESVTLESPFYAPERGFYLNKGWNWLGYPLTVSQRVEDALSTFSPSEGDKVVGRQGFVTYENGTWNGTLNTFEPGKGYMYMSKTSKSLAFTNLSAARSKAAPRFHAQARTPWTVADAPYPDVMGIVASITRDGLATGDNEYSIGAFDENGTCRGIGQYIDGKLFISVFGNGNEQINFRATEASTGIIYEVDEQLTFTSDVIGSRKTPKILHIGLPTDVASMKQGTAVVSTVYYNLSGTIAGTSKSQLAKGVYVVRYILRDGSTISKKIVHQ